MRWKIVNLCFESYLLHSTGLKIYDFFTSHLYLFSRNAQLQPQSCTNERLMNKPLEILSVPDFMCVPQQYSPQIVQFWSIFSIADVGFLFYESTMYGRVIFVSLDLTQTVRLYHDCRTQMPSRSSCKVRSPESKKINLSPVSLSEKKICKSLLRGP